MADLEKQNEFLIKDPGVDVAELEQKLVTVYESLVGIDTMVVQMVQNAEGMYDVLLKVCNIDFSNSTLNKSLVGLIQNIDSLVKTVEKANMELVKISKLQVSTYNSISSMPNESKQQESVKTEGVSNDFIGFINFINETIAGILFEKMSIKLLENIPRAKGVVKSIGTDFLIKELTGFNEVKKVGLSIVDIVSYIGEKLWGFVKGFFKILKSFGRIIKELPKGKLLLATIVAYIMAHYGMRRGEELGDLRKNIDELGEKEGRIAAGTGFMDRQALFQYDKEQLNMSMLEEWWFGDDSALDEDQVSYTDYGVNSMFSGEIVAAATPVFILENSAIGVSGIFSGLLNDWNEFVALWKESGVYKWWTENVEPFFAGETWTELGSGMPLGLSIAWSGFVELWKTTGIYKWWKEDIEPFFTEENWTFSSIETGLLKAWRGAVNSIKRLWNEFATWINEKLVIKIDTSTVIGEGIYDLLGTDSITIATLPTFEIGGFPEDGLFMANHGEMIGKFSNGRSVVANNEQIVGGIKHGVREAVSEVLAPYLADIAQNTRETANKDFATYIGDKEIARASERGRRAMGLRLITEY